MFSWLPYFSAKLIPFSCIRLLVCVPVISPLLLVEFPFVVLKYPILSDFFLPFLYIFLIYLLSGSFPQVVLLFIFCVAFSFLSLHVLPFFLCFIILVCFRRFFYLRFQSNFPSRIWFFFSVLFEVTAIFLQTKFAPAYISFFNSVILFLHINVSPWFFCFHLDCSPFYIS